MTHEKRLKDLENRSPTRPHIVIYNRYGKYWRNNPRHDNSAENEITPDQLQDLENEYILLIVSYDRIDKESNYE